MKCEAAQENLKSLCDGELGRLTAGRIRRHLRRCPSCAKELTMLQKLNALLLAADLVERDASAAGHSAFAEVPHRPSSQIWRGSRIQWAGAAAALVAIAILALATFRPTDALAAALQAVAQMKSWKTCHLVARSPGGTTTIEEWLRVPDEIHHEVYHAGALDSLKVQNAHETWLYQADRNLAVHSHSHAKDIPPVGSFILGTALGPLPFLERLQEESRRGGGLTVHERQERMPDGRPVRVIDIQIDLTRLYGTHPGTLKTRHEIVYLDAQTERLVKWDSATDGWTYEILSCDQPLPETVFTWQPPAGVKVVEFTDWWETRQNQKLATAMSEEWEVTVHAVDIAANGDVWLTVSRRARAAETGASEKPSFSTWASEGMTLADERRRVYVQFAYMPREGWPHDRALLGFTPLEPRRESDPLPSLFSANLYAERKPGTGRPTGDGYQVFAVSGLAAPAPAPWLKPPMSPLDPLKKPAGGSMADATENDPLYSLFSKLKEQARRAYREGNDLRPR